MRGPAFARPRVVISRCLGFAACRWDGSMITDRFAQALARHVEMIPVCPEDEVGMGTPRRPLAELRGQPGQEGPAAVEEDQGRS